MLKRANFVILLLVFFFIAQAPAEAETLPFQLLYQKNGDSASDNLGYSVAGAGDVNGDSKADFIVGAPFASPGGPGFAGSAFVYSGADGSILYRKDGASIGRVVWPFRQRCRRRQRGRLC